MVRCFAPQWNHSIVRSFFVARGTEPRMDIFVVGYQLSAVAIGCTPLLILHCFQLLYPSNLSLTHPLLLLFTYATRIISCYFTDHDKQHDKIITPTLPPENPLKLKW